MCACVSVHISLCNTFYVFFPNSFFFHFSIFAEFTLWACKSFGSTHRWLCFACKSFGICLIGILHRWKRWGSKRAGQEAGRVWGVLTSVVFFWLCVTANVGSISKLTWHQLFGFVNRLAIVSSMHACCMHPCGMALIHTDPHPQAVQFQF